MSDRPTLLVDARNCMYRGIYAFQKEAARGARPQRHPFTHMLGIIASWVREFDPRDVQMFWDTPRAKVWRRKVYPGYKDRDNNNYIADLSQELVRTQRVARTIFQHMNVHQFLKDHMEADDLIYAACRQQHSRPLIICSTDSDMLQIPYMLQHVQVYNPEKKKLAPRASCHPALQKALIGDESDRIGGYVGIGPVRSEKLLADPVALHNYLQEHGRGIWIRNLLLIDLSLCPHLLANQLYVDKVLASPLQFDRSELARLEQEHKVAGLMRDYADLVQPFQRLRTQAKPTGSAK